MTTQYTLVPPGHIVTLTRETEAAMCLEVARLELAGKWLASVLIKEMYDLDEIWIWEAREDLEAGRIQ